MRNDTFWSAAARYCSELAPVAGPLLQAASDLATALERASLAPAATHDAPSLPASPENE